jgi:hypothetical protein
MTIFVYSHKGIDVLQLGLNQVLHRYQHCSIRAVIGRRQTGNDALRVSLTFLGLSNAIELLTLEYPGG